MTEELELNFANSLFVSWLKKKKGWSDVPAENMFSLWAQYGEEFKEVFKKVTGE